MKSGFIYIVLMQDKKIYIINLTVKNKFHGGLKLPWEINVCDNDPVQFDRLHPVNRIGQGHCHRHFDFYGGSHITTMTISNSVYRIG